MTVRHTFKNPDGETVAVGVIDSLPGSSQVAVFHSAFVRPDYRGQGYGFNAHNDRLTKAIELGYDYAICTVDISNTKQVNILLDSGWSCLNQFKSSKTEHIVGVYGIKLR